MSDKKRFDYRHIICIIITVFIGGGLGYLFRASFLRLYEALKDFGLCVAYYFCELFEIEYSFNLGINNISDKLPKIKFPIDWEGFKASFLAFWANFKDPRVFVDYLIISARVAKYLAYLSTILIPLIVAIYLLVSRSKTIVNNDYAKETKSLKTFKSFSKRVYTPVKGWVVSFLQFAKEKRYFKIWLVELFFIFNLGTVIVEFLAFYFYFVTSWDFKTIFIQIYKLFVDLMPTLKFIPLIVWIIVGLVIFGRWRTKIGYSLLNHNENKNRGFINERPICSMIVGSMGTGKTTTAVDMVLSQEVMFRDKALAILIDIDVLFPFFPWINLENHIKRLIENGTVFNLASINQYFKKLEQYFLAPSDEQLVELGELPFSNGIYDYNHEKYGLFKDDGLKNYWIFDVIREYAKAYFVYIIQSVYIISNLSVRNDDSVVDCGNLPVWTNDFFKVPVDAPSRFSHIIDYDAFRLGNKIIKENVKSNFFEFGIVLITEIGKERGNALENQEQKKKALEANQKNDRFNDFLKMIRHSATIWNYSFVKVITDEQRAMSWGADARELCEIVHIHQRSEERLAIPLFALEKSLYEVLRPGFERWYVDYRMRRGDYTLPFYLKKLFYTKFFSWYLKKSNIFGYYKLKVKIADGGELDSTKSNYYYLSTKKIYSDRFRSDCFSDYFYAKSISSNTSLDEVPAFEGVLARLDEMKLMNSYFFNNLCELVGVKMKDE